LLAGARHNIKRSIWESVQGYKREHKWDLCIKNSIKISGAVNLLSLYFRCYEMLWCYCDMSAMCFVAVICIFFIYSIGGRWCSISFIFDLPPFGMTSVIPQNVITHI
jgi:hypothetical protein